MRAALVALLCVKGLTAREIDSQVLRMIPPEVFAVAGIDNERFIQSPFAKLAHEDHAGAKGQTLEVALGTNPPTALTITIGYSPDAGIESPTADIQVYKGFRIIQTGWGAAFASLRDGITLKGDQLTLRTAIDRYLNHNVPAAPFMARVQRVAAEFDAWFVIDKPLAHAETSALESLPAYARKAAESIEGAEGGVRFGRMNDFEARVTAASSEEASALAVLGRWAPGFVRMQGSDERRLMDVIENLTFEANGRVAILTFSVADSNIERLMEEDENKRKARAAQTAGDLRAPDLVESPL